MAFTKKNVTRSKYTRAKRVKRVKKTNKRRSQKCVKGGGEEEHLKGIVHSINRSGNVDYYVIIEKEGYGTDTRYTIQKFTLPTIKTYFLKGSKSNFNKLNFKLGEIKVIKRNEIRPIVMSLTTEEPLEERNLPGFDPSVILNTMRRLGPGCILKYHDDIYELDVSLTEQFVYSRHQMWIPHGGNKKIGG